MTHALARPDGGSSGAQPASQLASWWRYWALFVAAAYAAVILAVLAWSSEPAWAALLTAPFMVADGIFALGLGAAGTPGRRRLRIVGWTLLLLGAVPLISFAFVLVPLVLSTAPAVFASEPPVAGERGAHSSFSQVALQALAAGLAVLGLLLLGFVFLGSGEESSVEVTVGGAPTRVP
ncbi:MAG: hypothetical protein HY875_13775 [Chloroflexi bacterium]|nr:hypothetical protein [Chloroflexota bacterium]